MNHARTFFPLLLIAIVAVSCGTGSDEEDIQAVLESSWFIGDGAIRTADDSTDTPQIHGPSVSVTDTIGYVRWVRWIERPVPREYDILVVGDSAFVTMSAFFQGTPPGYGLFVINDPLAPLYQRAIGDSVTRKVKLHRGSDDRWHIASLTAADIRTINPVHPVMITEIRAEVASRNYLFVMNSADTYFKKDELPIFFPSDTVVVTVTANAQGDSTWAFLHHGTGHRPRLGCHIRQPFFREGTTSFSRSWVIADDSISVTPAVRHSAVDVLGWETLFGDSMATYYAHAWALPYIVKLPEEEIPSDEEE